MARTIHTFDTVIIGGGTAGISALEEALKHSDNVLLITENANGNTCAKTGCMPSKSLIHAAKLFHDRKNMKEAGIKGTEHLHPDIPEILRKVREKRHFFMSETQKNIDRHHINIIIGKARFESPTKIRTASRLIHAKTTIIATGAHSYTPAAFQDFQDKIITTDTLFEQTDLPARMAVIGLGLLGLEMSQALARLGIEVTAIERNGNVGDVADPDICKQVLTMLENDMRVWTHANHVSYERSGDSILIKNGEKETVEVDSILLCAGRRPNTANLGLKRLGVPMDSSGVPHFNRYTMQVPNFPIYLAGDVTDERAVLHEAYDEGKRAAYHALTGKVYDSQRKVPLTIIFTHPNIAIIGDSQYTMRRNGIVVGEASFGNQGRATIENENYGKIRISADEETGIIRGCEMMAPQGEHLAHLIALAITQGLNAKKLLQMPFYHPSFEEALQTACKMIDKKIAAKSKH